MRSNGVADAVAFEDSIELLRRQAADPYFSLPRMSSTSLAPISVPSTTSIGRRPSSIMCGRNKKALASSALHQTSRTKVKTCASRTRRSLSSAESLSCRFFRRASVARDTMRCLKFASLGATNRQRRSSAASGNPFSIRSMNSNGEAGRLPRCLSPRTPAISSKPAIGEAPYHVRHNIVSHDTGVNPPVLTMPLRPPCVREALDHRAPFALRDAVLRTAPHGEVFETPAVVGSSSFETRPPGAPQDEAALCVASAIEARPHSTLTLRSGPKDRVSKGHPEERS